MSLFSKIININFTLSKAQWLVEQKIKATAIILLIVAGLLTLFSTIRFINQDIVAAFADGFGAFLFAVFLYFLKKDVKYYNIISILALGILSLVITIGLFTAQHDILRGVWFISFMPLISYLRDYKEGLIWMSLYIAIMIVSYFFNPNPNIVGYFLIIINIVVASSVLYFYDKLKNIETTHITNEKEILEEEVNKRTEELKKLNLLLEEKITSEINKNVIKDKMLIQQSKMAMMGEMIGNITHQFRQPLSAIGSTSSSMLVNMELGLETTQEELKKKLTNISGFVDHLSGTITDFRNFFKEDKEVTSFNLSQSINKDLFIIESTLEANNIKIVKNFDFNIEVTTLKNELTQSILNILNNAKDAIIEYIPNNDEKLIIIDIKKENEKIEISIKDNAGGIPDDILSKVFDENFTTKEDNDGTGIGLYMTKRMIKNNIKGKIIVSNLEFTYNNNTYKGAQFRIIL